MLATCERNKRGLKSQDNNMTEPVKPETYVFEQTEVRLTGRTAENKLRSGKVDVVHEITPVETIIGTWKKWIRLDQLFKVAK